jgi:NitT/TauT family transport system permease protein
VNRFFTFFRLFLAVLAVVTLLFGARTMYHLLAATKWSTWATQWRDMFFTLLRVVVATLIGSLWAIPLGVYIGTHATWTRRLQPVVQVVASFPAPMVFPMVTFVLLRLGVSLQFGAMVLMLFASQWYLLFNVIAGAAMIPAQMKDVAQIFRLSGWKYWRNIILPAIFPSLVNGWITAAGGAWNASIVAETVRYGDQLLSANGIGADITLAANAADFPSLASGVMIMVVTVVLINRLLWSSLYRLAETRFRMD